VAELFELRVDLNYVLNYPSMEKYISLFPPVARQTEGAPTPIHSVGTSNATDEKREALREWVRVQMRAGEMADEPETLERKQRPAQQGPAEPWQSVIGKKTQTKGKGKAKQDLEVLDDFFEGDDSDTNEGVEAEEEEEEREDVVLSVPAEVRTKRGRTSPLLSSTRTPKRPIQERLSTSGTEDRLHRPRRSSRIGSLVMIKASKVSIR